MVNANTENPERCVALLDFVSTYDFSRIAWNGLEGQFWNVEDGEAVPTDDYLKVTKDDAFAVETGVNVYIISVASETEQSIRMTVLP